jgi:hypothetical protein
MHAIEGLRPFSNVLEDVSAFSNVHVIDSWGFDSVFGYMGIDEICVVRYIRGLCYNRWRSVG